MEKNRKTLTTSSGMPIDNNQFSQTAGPKGPVLLQDFALVDKLAKFDR
jgi:catalase